MILDTLVAGRRLLIEGGWIQGAAYGMRGGYCMVGALSFSCVAADPAAAVAVAAVEYHRACFALREAIGIEENAGGAAAQVAAWNDAEGRTKEEVIAVFDAAIAKLSPVYVPAEWKQEVPA